jgi:DegV family protein with EDD domain
VNLTAENTAIVLDSTADFTDEARGYRNWRVVPLYVRFGDESFRDYVDLAPSDFYARLRTAETTPTTSQPTPGDFMATYDGLTGYDRVFSLHISGKLSGTVQSAETAAAEAVERVRVIDTDSVSATIALLALAVQRRLARGTTDEEIDALVERFRREYGILFTVDTLEFLRRGGRIGRARQMAGQLLNVKPILAIREGEVLPEKRVRGSQKALEAIVELLVERTPDRPGLRIGIGHADAKGRADALAALAREARPSATFEVLTSLGAVVGAHAGPGTVGFFWFDDPDADSVRTGS